VTVPPSVWRGHDDPVQSLLRVKVNITVSGLAVGANAPVLRLFGVRHQPEVVQAVVEAVTVDVVYFSPACVWHEHAVHLDRFALNLRNGVAIRGHSPPVVADDSAGRNVDGGVPHGVPAHAVTFSKQGDLTFRINRAGEVSQR
jgi:hypothetical protein